MAQALDLGRLRLPEFPAGYPFRPVVKSLHFPREGLPPMGSPARSSQTVHFADYVLDLQTAELRRKGHKTILQDQPFHILTTLLESPGQLVTREELIKKLWPAGTFVD